MSDKLTDKELDLLEEFLKASADLFKSEPQQITGEEMDFIDAAYNEMGEIPVEYQDKIGIKDVVVHDVLEKTIVDKDGKAHGVHKYVPEGKTVQVFYDKEAEAWLEESNRLKDKYHDVIEKAIRFVLKQSSQFSNTNDVGELLQELIQKYGDMAEEDKRQLTSIIPVKHNLAVNKLANKITEPHIAAIGKSVSLDVGKNCKRKTISTFILDYSGNVTINRNQPVGEYDMAIITAASDLWDYGDESHIFTPAILFRAMVNATETETPSPTQIAEVTENLEKLSCTRITIDCSEELKKHNRKLNGYPITGGRITTALLDLDKIEIEAGGNTVTAFKMNRKPFLHSYAEAVKQIETVPAELLDIRDGTGAKVSNSKRRIAIKNYLMRHIIIMKRKGKGNNILYDNMLTSIEYNKVFSKDDRKKIREYIYIVLDYWKSKRFIKSYDDVKQGRSFTGINVQV